MRIPNPFISEYYVRRMKHSVDFNGRVSIGWATKAPEVVNTLDIEATLKQPNTFLVGWTETHYEINQRQVKDRIIDCTEERYVRHEHPFNPVLIMAAAKNAEAAAQAEAMTVLPVIRSYERILFALNWKFKLKPVGESDDTWAAFDMSDEIRYELAGQPELKYLTDSASIPPKPVLETPHASTEGGVLPYSLPNVDAGDRLSQVETEVQSLGSKMDLILELLNGKANSGTGHGEPRPSRSWGEAGHSNNSTHTGSTNSVMYEPGQTAHKL